MKKYVVFTPSDYTIDTEGRVEFNNELVTNFCSLFPRDTLCRVKVKANTRKVQFDNSTTIVPNTVFLDANYERGPGRSTVIAQAGLGYAWQTVNPVSFEPGTPGGEEAIYNNKTDPPATFFETPFNMDMLKSPTGITISVAFQYIAQPLIRQNNYNAMLCSIGQISSDNTQFPSGTPNFNLQMYMGTTDGGCSADAFNAPIPQIINNNPARTRLCARFFSSMGDSGNAVLFDTMVGQYIVGAITGTYVASMSLQLNGESPFLSLSLHRPMNVGLIGATIITEANGSNQAASWYILAQTRQSSQQNWGNTTPWANLKNEFFAGSNNSSPTQARWQFFVNNFPGSPQFVNKYAAFFDVTRPSPGRTSYDTDFALYAKIENVYFEDGTYAYLPNITSTSNVVLQLKGPVHKETTSIPSSNPLTTYLEGTRNQEYLRIGPANQSVLFYGYSVILSDAVCIRKDKSYVLQPNPRLTFLAHRAVTYQNILPILSDFVIHEDSFTCVLFNNQFVQQGWFRNWAHFLPRSLQIKLLSNGQFNASSGTTTLADRSTTILSLLPINPKFAPPHFRRTALTACEFYQSGEGEWTCYIADFRASLLYVGRQTLVGSQASTVLTDVPYTGSDMVFLFEVEPLTPSVAKRMLFADTLEGYMKKPRLTLI